MTKLISLPQSQEQRPVQTGEPAGMANEELLEVPGPGQGLLLPKPAPKALLACESEFLVSASLQERCCSGLAYEDLWQ